MNNFKTANSLYNVYKKLHINILLVQVIVTSMLITSAIASNPIPKYKREDWRHWSDFDHDCMNTRHEILQAQSKVPVTKNKKGCSVISGVWHGHYSGKTFTKPSDIDIDHVVPLAWAHKHGGASWSKRRKKRFANDPINLLAVDDGLNQQKGAKGPMRWMPPNKKFRCQYLEIWTKVLKKYSLRMNSRESANFRKKQVKCNDYLTK